MKLSWPIKNISPTKPIQYTGAQIYISQEFGNVWIAPHDMTINGKFVKKGQNVYKVAFGLAWHDGIDIAAPKGTEVSASHDGWIVESVAKDTGYGLRCQIYFEEDGYGWLVINGHFDKLAFPDIPYNLKERRYPLKEGQLIGWVDSTGFSNGHHDHFALRQLKDFKILNQDNGTFGWINPRPFMKDPNVLQGKPMNIYKDNRTNPPTIIVGNPVDNETNLKWICSQNGRPLPLMSNSDKVDFSKINYDGEINP